MAPTSRQLAQDGFDVRLEWGPDGLERLAPVATTLVVVDVLSFTTSVTVAVDRGAEVLPYRWQDAGEAAFAASRGAVLPGRRGEPGALTLSPHSLLDITAGTRLVLPSANGSALSFAAAELGATCVVAGSLRNATAVARYAAARRGPIALVPGGERWHGAHGPLRPAIEDLLGAGAIIAALPDLLRRSPEAAVAAAAFRDARSSLYDRLAASVSGRELIGNGWGNDVLVAGKHDASGVVPVLDDDTYRAA